MMKIRDSFHPYALVTVLFWSLAYVLTRLALGYFSSFALGFLRYVVASCTLLGLAVLTKMKPPRRGDLGWFALAGAAGFFLYMIAFNKGCETVPASTSSVIIATAPIITALLANFVYKERLRPFQWAAIAISFGGVVVLTSLNGALAVNQGFVWLFLAAVLVSGYNLIQRRLTKIYTPLQTSAFSIFAGTIMLGIFLPASARELRGVPPVQLLYVAILGIFSSAIAYLCWSKAFAKAEYTSSVSNYMFAIPMLTTLLGFLLAGETPDLATVVGGAIILSGLLSFNFGDKIYARLRAGRKI